MINFARITTIYQFVCSLIFSFPSQFFFPLIYLIYLEISILFLNNLFANLFLLFTEQLSYFSYLSDVEWHNKRDADLVRLQLLKREINEEKLSAEEVRAVAAHMITNCTQIQTLLGMRQNSVLNIQNTFF